MESRAAVLGHPIHVILVAFPIALFMTAFLADAVYVWRRDPFWRRCAFWMLLFGELGAIAAIVPGLIDYYLIPMPASAREVATQHMFLGFALAGLGAVLVFLRRREAGEAAGATKPGLGRLIFPLVLASAVGAQGGLGGELTFGHGVGIRPQPAARGEKEDASATGPQLFADYCAGCHGDRGQGGTGPSLTQLSLAPEAARAVVANGRGMMPAFRTQLGDRGVRVVTAFALTLRRKR